MESLLQAENISKRYGDKLLFENISLSIGEGQKIALVAKNGTGKTSLLNILAGADSPDGGSLSRRRDVRIGYLPQEIEMDSEKTVLDAVFVLENEITQTIRQYNDCLYSESHEVLPSLLDKMDALNAWDYESRIKQILGKLDIHDLDKKIGTLSGGQKKRVALAGLLICEPQLLILDEPTNQLDLNVIEWLEDYLSVANITIFMVTHDRYFLDRICDTIIEMDGGNIYSYSGNYTYYVEKRAERIENLQANIERAQNLMRTEQEWIRRMPKARSHKAKYRIDEFENLKARASQRIDNRKLELDVANQRLGKKIIDIYNISKSYGEQKIIDEFSYKVTRGEKIGIVGRNGVGKTTFLNLITGNLAPDSGHIEIGQTVKFAYYTQDGIAFNDDDKPIDIVRKISDDVKLRDGKSFSASGLLNYFMFTGDMQHTLVRKLSGGEKRRLYLCTVLIQQPNVLIMDEPTNDLDITTLQVLEEYLTMIDATVIIVSHDRFFMDKIVDHLFVFEGDGKISDFPGNYTQFRDSDAYIRYLGTTQPKEEKPAKEANAEPRKPINAPKKKLSYKDQREYDMLEKEIEELNAKRVAMEEELNSGRLSPFGIAAKSSEYSQLIDSIDEKEMRWLELAEMLE